MLDACVRASSGLQINCRAVHVQNDIMKDVLAASGCVAVLASEEDEEAVEVGQSGYAVVFDPLDGSRNIDASIPTGTIFGVYDQVPSTSGAHILLFEVLAHQLPDTLLV